jgi:hypothetical protein
MTTQPRLVCFLTFRLSDCIKNDDYSFLPAAKGRFIKNTALKGFAMWQTGGDYADILLDAISEASGIQILSRC